MTLSALNDQDCLREVRGVDDRELSASGRGYKNEDYGSDDCTAHHWGLLLRLDIELLARAS